MQRTIQFTLNGHPVSAQVGNHQNLVEVLQGQGLFGARPALLAPRGQRLATIAGTVPELVDLPKDPSISPAVSLWKGLAKPLAVAGVVGAMVAGFFHYMKVGPVEDKAEKEEA